MMPINYSKYPPNWRSEIRPRILIRANNCCEFCGIKNGSTAQSAKGKDYKIVLTIAHLDHDETNHDVSDDRLRALCQPCHLKYDAEEKARRRRVKKYASSLFPINENEESKGSKYPNGVLLELPDDTYRIDTNCGINSNNDLW